MSISPRPSDEYDVPKELALWTRRVHQGKGVSALGEVGASAVFQMLTHFAVGGEFVITDHLPEHDIQGVGRRYLRKREASTATNAAFIAAFGQGYGVGRALEEVRVVMAAEVLQHEKDKATPEMSSRVLAFFNVWHEELEKLSVPA